MRWLALLLALITAVPVQATTYYMATTGSDSNDGLGLGTPWLTPNHAVNCGDVILAAAGSYPALQNFGTVTCPAANSVAWLACATFDTCKISASTNGISVNNNYWGVRGWEVTTTGTFSACFQVEAPTSSPIHHIVFANDIANSCQANGFSFFNNGTGAFDYVAVVASIAYNAAQSNFECFSGISEYQPAALDSNAGTHIYFGYNYAFDNVDASPCASAAPTDGEGVILDDNGGTYSQQMVADNNILVFNGGRGFASSFNSTNPSARYVRNNTAYGNNTDTTQTTSTCTEFLDYQVLNSQMYGNLAATSGATHCNSNTWWLFTVDAGDSTTVVRNNYGYSAAGNNTQSLSPGSGFVFGPGNTFASFSFSNPVNPSAPSCGSFSSVPACMATLIANFTPTSSPASTFGYQPISLVSKYDPLFPQWLCNVSLPPGLLTMGCPTQATFSGGTLAGAKVQ